MQIEALLSYIIACLYFNKKFNLLTDEQTGKQYQYAYNKNVYDYANNIYYRINSEKTGISVYDYHSGKYYYIKPESPGIYLANQIGTEEFYQIIIDKNKITTTNKKKAKANTFSIR